MDPLKRGDVITVAGSGDFAGKPRPAIVVQSDLFNATHSSVSVVPVTTTLVDADLFRIRLTPSKKNGLRSTSQAMADKITSVRRERIGAHVGALTGPDMERLDEAVRTWLAL
jgi:mRNA interferase MazF